jgi:hypothetical protein
MLRTALFMIGGFLVLAGISGTVDHLVGQPLMGVLLNVFNRFVFPFIGPLEGYEVYANLSVAGVGLAVLCAAPLAPRT